MKVTYIKSILLFVLIGLFLFSCSNSKMVTNSNEKSSEEDHPVEFEELRRLNYEGKLDEITIINSLDELVKVYERFKDPNTPRSAPIPNFADKNEYVLIIKPTLIDREYADIEIDSLTHSGSKLLVNYKEIENWEYSQNKWKNPVVILKVKGSSTQTELNKL